jgi:hypothetical protein
MQALIEQLVTTVGNDSPWISLVLIAYQNKQTSVALHQ